MKLKKDLIRIIILIVFIILTVFKMECLAEEDTQYTFGDWRYTINGNEATIIGYDGNNVEVNIPEYINAYKVTSLGAWAISDKDTITSITIPNTVTKIGGWAFAADKNLININIPNSVTSIEQFAFSKCSNLKQITMPNSVRTLGEYAFWNCQTLSDVVLSNKLTEIKSSTFSNCTELKNIVMPDSITSIGAYAFGECTSLKSVILPRQLKELGHQAFWGCTNLVNVDIQENLETIDKEVFSGCENLTKITLPNSVNKIGSGAFIKCGKLKSIVIPEGVTEIGYVTFDSCYELQSITLPRSLTKIEGYPFCCLSKIYGYKGSYAEQFAKEKGITFRSLSTQDEVIKGSFKCVNNSFSEEFGFRYTDDYFRDEAYNYNQHLATMSLCLAYSAYNTNPEPYNKDEDYKNNRVDSNVRDVLEKCKFNMDQYKQYNYYAKPKMDDIACAIANKKIDDTTLIAIAVRGGGYEKEWGSNFTVYTEGDHSGFESSADIIYKRLEQYITFWGIKGNIKIWITGFSRAGAVSNLLAARLNNGSHISGADYNGINDVYAYCFATPAGADVSNSPNSEGYCNIYSIVHYDDPVPLVAPAYWGFDRYGTTYVFPYRESLKGASTYENNMLKRLDQMGVEDYKIRHFKDEYYPLNQDSLGTFLRKFVKSARHNITVNKELGVIRPLYSRINFWSSGLQDNLRKTFSEIYKPYEKVEWVDILKAFWQEVVSEGLLHSSQIETATDNLSILAIAHAEATYYLSWMQSMDSYYVKGARPKFADGTGRLLYINCPVDVYVYDRSSNLVAAIENETPKQIEGSDIIASIDENGQKIIYLPKDEIYEVKTKAREDCKTTITINEYDGFLSETSKILGCNEIEMKKGEEVVAKVTNYIENDDTSNTESGATYTLEKNKKELEQDIQVSAENIENNTFEITTKYDETQGIVEGGGEFTIGNFCKLTATANLGYKFDGWYISNKKVSDEEEYRFAVKESQEIEAKFNKDNSFLLGDIDGDDEITAFDAYTALEKSLNPEIITEQEKNVLDIDKDGDITAFDAYLILAYSVGIVDESYWK